GNRLFQHACAQSTPASMSGGDRCTYTENETFFSYRRDKTTGRMASFIWLI
ncbi:peptidoglycan editing factor PgeF, partial [Escherichia coli]|nr:peptidoglycan editing factor PgeF [Escherichia coli]